MSFVNAHFVTYARDLGFSPMVAAGAFSLIGAASIVGALILGHLFDKHGRRLWLSFSYNLRSVGFLVVLLSMGISFIGILIYFVVGYSFERVALAGALGAAIAFMGVLLTARFMLWEDEGSIVFQGGSLELSFPYKSSKASGDVNKLITQFFKIKNGTNSHRSGYLQAPESTPPDSPYSPPQHERPNDF